jgi:hypothetical protein
MVPQLQGPLLVVRQFFETNIILMRLLGVMKMFVNND